MIVGGGGKEFPAAKNNKGLTSSPRYKQLTYSQLLATESTMDPIHRLKTTTVPELTMSESEYVTKNFSSTTQLALVMDWQILFSKLGHGNISGLTRCLRTLLLSNQEVEFIFFPLEAGPAFVG